MVPVVAGPAEETVAVGPDVLVAPSGIVEVEPEETLRVRVPVHGAYPHGQMARQVGETEGPGPMPRQIAPRQVVEEHGWAIEGIAGVGLGRPPFLQAAENDLDGGPRHP